MLSSYMKRRRKWQIKTAKMITDAVEKAELHWSEIMEARIELAKKELVIEKDSVISQLQGELKDARKEIRRLNKVDLEVMKYRDKLIGMVKKICYRQVMVKGVLSSIGVQLASDDILVEEAEKLLDKAPKI